MYSEYFEVTSYLGVKCKISERTYNSWIDKCFFSTQLETLISLDVFTHPHFKLMSYCQHSSFKQ